MAGLDPAIQTHFGRRRRMDGRVKPVHDALGWASSLQHCALQPHPYASLLNSLLTI